MTQVINKAEIIRRGYIDSTKLERAILCESEHPFIVRLRFAFQNGSKLYLVTDFYNGGNLLVHLKRNCAFPERAARFFAAEVFLAIEYLHRRGIVYRDLKVRQKDAGEMHSIWPDTRASLHVPSTDSPPPTKQPTHSPRTCSWSRQATWR